MNLKHINQLLISSCELMSCFSNGRHKNSRISKACGRTKLVLRHSCRILFWRWSVRLAGGTPAVLDQVFVVSLRSSRQIRGQYFDQSINASSQIVCSSSSFNRAAIPRYIVDTGSVVRELESKAMHVHGNESGRNEVLTFRQYRFRI